MKGWGYWTALATTASPIVILGVYSLIILVLVIGIPITISKMSKARAKRKASERVEKEEVESTMKGWGYWTALATTVGPIVILSVYSAVRAAAIGGDMYNKGNAHMFWFVAAALWVIACVAEIVFISSSRVKSQIVKGIVVGIWLGIVSLLVTCGVNLGTLGAE